MSGISGTREELLAQAKIVLSALLAEKIRTPENTESFPWFTLNKLRKSVPALVQLKKLSPPQLIASAAISLLGFSACQELAQRFALEFSIFSPSAKTHLIFLGHPGDLSSANHVFVLLGDAFIPETLETGKTDHVRFPNPEFFMPLDSFIAAQLKTQAIFSDPLLELVASEPTELSPLTTYCDKHRITHVLAIRSYASTPGFLDTVAPIKEKALWVAREIKEEMEEKIGIKSAGGAGRESHSAAEVVTLFLDHLKTSPELQLKKEALEALKIKYKLTKHTSAELEKGLRRAAFEKNKSDITSFLSFGVDINAAGPESGKTALHIAVEKNDLELVLFLLQRNANMNLKDKENKTPKDYVRSEAMSAALIQVELMQKMSELMTSPAP